MPAALLGLGLVAARRGGPALAGGLLGLGAAAKWFPGLAVPVLALGLWREGDRRGALTLTAASAVGFAVPHLPFLGDAAQRSALLGAYTFHADRGITGESLAFLPLHALGLVARPDRPWSETDASQTLSTAALLVLLAVLAALVVAAWRRPDRALGLAATAPAVFLLGNRIFSPQFLLPLAVVWAAGLALTPASRRPPPPLVVALLAAAATANYAVWPTLEPSWVWLQWAMFVAAVALTWLATRARGAADGRWGTCEQPRSSGLGTFDAGRG